MCALSVIGSAIGGYRILGPLGVGATGAVYLAEHPLLGRRVAVKILHPGRAADEEAVAAFFADCTLARELDHPSIAGIVELSSVATPAGKLPCVIAELLEGRTLAEQLADSGALAPARAVVIAEQIASALETAHGAGLVHGALKSENIFRSELDHPSIAGIVELSSVATPAGKLPCVIAELLEGRTLAEQLADSGALAPARAVVIAEQIASALETAHGAGLVHGALKSENIF